MDNIPVEEFGRALYVGMDRQGHIFEGRMPREKTKTWLRDWKSMGNQSFAEKDYATADSHYTIAINLYRNRFAEGDSGEIDDDDKLVISQIFSNRSACRFEMHKHADAASDGEDAIRIYPCSWKAYYRTAKAYEELGQKEKAVLFLLKGVKLGRPEREQRCIMLVQAISMALQLKPHPMAVLLGMTSSMPYVADIVALIQNDVQWQRIIRLLGKENKWREIKILLAVVDENEVINCGKQTHLKGLVEYAERDADFSEYSDHLARWLLHRGAHPQTLQIGDDPPVFGALRLGLKGQGLFHTLRYFMEFVLVRDKDGKNAKDHLGRNMFEFIDNSAADGDLRAESRKVLHDYGVGVHVNVQDDILFTAQVLNDQGAKLLNDGENEKTITVLTEAIASIDSRTSNEEQWNIYMNRSGAYWNLDRLLEARLDTKQAVELMPSKMDGWQRLFKISDKLGLKESAIAAAQVMHLMSPEIAEHLIRTAILVSSIHDEGFEEIVGIMDLSLDRWTSIIEDAFHAGKWRQISALFTMKSKNIGSLRDYKADKLDLSRLMDPRGTGCQSTALSLFMQLIERGAKPQSFVPRMEDELSAMLIKGRPVSYAFVQAVLCVNNFLDCFLEREEELKEPGYPDPNNLLHQLIEKYKSLSTTKRCIFTGSISAATVQYLENSDSGITETLILGLNDSETDIYKKAKYILDRADRL